MSTSIAHRQEYLLRRRENMLAVICLPVLAIVAALGQDVGAPNNSIHNDPIEIVIRQIVVQHNRGRRHFLRRFTELSQKIGDAIDVVSSTDDASVERLWKLCKAVTKQYWHEVHLNFDEQTRHAEQAAVKAIGEFMETLSPKVRHHQLVQYFISQMLHTFKEYKGLSIGYLKSRETDEMRDLFQCFGQVWAIRECTSSDNGPYRSLSEYRQALRNVYEAGSEMMFQAAVNYWDMNELLIENAARRVRALVRPVHKIRSLELC